MTYSQIYLYLLCATKAAATFLRKDSAGGMEEEKNGGSESSLCLAGEDEATRATTNKPAAT